MSDWLAKHFNKEVVPFGRLISSHSRAGERIYFFEKSGSISLVPAELVDEEYARRELTATELQREPVVKDSFTTENP